MENIVINAHSDRCFNPFNIKSHKGTNLRPLSKNARQKHLPVSAKICSSCRKLSYPNSSDLFNESLPVEDKFSEEVEESNATKKFCFSRQDELEQLLDGLKEKLSSLPKSDPLRVSILTITSPCWNIHQIASEFNVPRSLAKKSRDLRNEKGVLAMPDEKKGKKLPDDTIEKVIEFYQSDNNSRILPNKKDVVTVTVNGIKEKVPKRLLLLDIKVLHRQFKEDYPQYPIGLTKFTELRPRFCVLAGESGTHSVCVCIIHQNFKSMFDAANLQQLTKDLRLPLNCYTDCFALSLCRNAKPICYIQKCQSCLNFENFSDYVTSVFNENDIDEVLFSVWKSTDKCTLSKECRR